MLAPEIQKLFDAVAELQAQIKEAQSACDHRSAIKKPDGNVGNYDPSNDSYWLDCVCPRCGKAWREDQ